MKLRITNNAGRAVNPKYRFVTRNTDVVEAASAITELGVRRAKAVLKHARGVLILLAF